MVKFNKIVLVSLCDKWTSELANMLAQSLDMMFCDTKELIEYELIDKQAIEKMCSKEYLEKSERKVLKHISSFENVLVSINYDYLARHFDLLKDNSMVIYLDIPKSFIKQNANPINFISHNKRSNHLKEISNITITLRKTEQSFVCQKIIEKLRSLI